MIFLNNRNYFLEHKLIYFKGGSSGDTYDAAYNARMATIAESQEGMAEDYFNFWETTFKPMETEQVQANRDLIPYEKALSKEQIQSQRELIPGQTSLTQAQIDAQSQLLPGQTQALEGEMQSRLEGLEARGGIRDAYYNEALNGLNPEAEADRAGTDAAHAFASSNETMLRDAARMGVGPESGRFAGASRTNSIERAKQIGGARSLARFQTEKEQFNRLNSAVGQGVIEGISSRPDVRTLGNTGTALDALDTYRAPATVPTNFKSVNPEPAQLVQPVMSSLDSYDQWELNQQKYANSNSNRP